MKEINIRDAVFEAYRFINRATIWLDRAKKDDLIEYGSPEGGALRRASMDLTRALAKMRKF